MFTVKSQVEFISDIRNIHENLKNIRLSAIRVDRSQKSITYDFICDKMVDEILREKIVCDLLESGAGKDIPHCLKIKDPLYKKAKDELTEQFGKNVSFALLYKTNKVFVVTQDEKTDFFGRKKGKLFKLVK
jgi:hypothetical protein